MKRFTDEEYETIKNTPRFTELDCHFLSRPFKAPDSASLLFLNIELFGREIYRFDSDSNEPYIIDAGANIGLSVIYFKQIFPKSQIVAFEPDSRIFKYLQSNMNSFGFKDVQLISKALWDEKTTLHFFSEGADGGHITDTADENSNIEVETTVLSSYLKERKVDFLKIDIEGAEVRVLKECGSLLKNVDNIYIEYHSGIQNPQELPTILNILTNCGFRYYIEHTGITSPNPLRDIQFSMGFDNQLHIWGYRHRHRTEISW